MGRLQKDGWLVRSQFAEAMSSTGFVQGQIAGVHGDRNEDTRQD
jgi:hypothetical protein